MPMTMIAPKTTAVHHAPAVVASGRKWRVSFALAIATAILLWASYFPWEWGIFAPIAQKLGLPTGYPNFPLNLGFCAWFALVPLMALVRGQQSTRGAFLTAWLGGFVFFLAALEWTRVAHPYMYATWVALSLYCSLYFAVSVPLLRRLSRIMPMTFALPLVWVSLEYLRAHLLTGFAWYFLGHTQHDYLTLIQIADFGGVYAVTALLAAGNGLLFEFLCGSERFRNFARIPAPTMNGRSLSLQAAVVLLLIGGTAGYGFWRLNQNAFTEGPQVAVLQCSVDQATRNSKGDDDNATTLMFKRMRELTEQARDFQPRPDLLIWPETTYPLDWLTVADDTPSTEIFDEYQQDVKAYRKLTIDCAKFSTTNVLLGLNTTELMPGRKYRSYNSALLLQRDGEPLGRYDKIHCVPFGEYVPMRSIFPWMQIFSPYKHDYSLECGTNQTRFRLPTESGKSFLFGALICYEDSVPELGRGYVSGSEPPVDFLVNLTNDGWFDGTEEHEQHLAISRFRAIETRRSLVRSVNMGISAVIDGNGRVVALPGPTWSGSKKIATAFAANVPVDSRKSIYAMFGDWFPTMCAALLGIAIIASWTRLTRGKTGDFGLESRAIKT